MTGGQAAAYNLASVPPSLIPEVETGYPLGEMSFSQRFVNFAVRGVQRGVAWAADAYVRFCLDKDVSYCAFVHRSTYSDSES